eukprot:9211743-Ditylum_brightwellii.AAC.1
MKKYDEDQEEEAVTGLMNWIQNNLVATCHQTAPCYGSCLSKCMCIHTSFGGVEDIVLATRVVSYVISWKRCPLGVRRPTLYNWAVTESILNKKNAGSHCYVLPVSTGQTKSAIKSL